MAPLFQARFWILAALAIGSGYLNAPAVGTEYFLKWVEPVGVEVELATSHGAADGDGEEALGFGALSASEGYSEGCGYTDPAEGKVCYAPKLPHAVFTWGKAAPSIVLVFAGIAVSGWLSMGVYGGRRNPFRGLTTRLAPARWVHTLLVNKYYLDHLYEKVIVRAVAHPIAAAAYWVNQHILDGIVNGVGTSGRRTGEWVYRNVDQRVVDVAVNASGLVASETGHALQPVQSGRVNQYGALLFGAATVGAIGLTGALAISVVERTREIGVMRSLGAKSGVISLKLCCLLAHWLIITGLAPWSKRIKSLNTISPITPPSRLDVGLLALFWRR
jgi:hypothetical protein